AGELVDRDRLAHVLEDAQDSAPRRVGQCPLAGLFESDRRFHLPDFIPYLPEIIHHPSAPPATIGHRPLRKDPAMRPTRVMANLTVPDIDEARSFYVDYLGLAEVDLGLDWVARFQTDDGGSAIQLWTRPAASTGRHGRRRGAAAEPSGSGGGRPPPLPTPGGAWRSAKACSRHTKKRGGAETRSSTRSPPSPGACGGSSCGRRTAPSST